MKRSSHLLISSLLLLSLTPSTSVWSQEGDDETLRCIPVTRIDRTEVIDDQNIAFYLKPDDIYINRLGRACSRLDREKRFSYRRSTAVLCANDLITVLQDSGFGLGRGASCGLGMFHPADEELVALLKGDEEPADINVEDIEVDE